MTLRGETMRVIGGAGHGLSLSLSGREAYCPTLDRFGYGHDTYRARFTRGHAYMAFAYHEDGRPRKRWQRHYHQEGKHYAKDWDGQWWQREHGSSEWTPAALYAEAAVNWSPPTLPRPTTTHDTQHARGQHDGNTQ